MPHVASRDVRHNGPSSSTSSPPAAATESSDNNSLLSESAPKFSSLCNVNESTTPRESELCEETTANGGKGKKRQQQESLKEDAGLDSQVVIVLLTANLSAILAIRPSIPTKHWEGTEQVTRRSKAVLYKSHRIHRNGSLPFPLL
ncbi:unnamed protein product [Linum trigynum]|uniref:Uncharacterized protein n=1 Tax=Linum trigynum TaxID=586398 RepID=A0AAV2FA06_9ROSI